MNKPKSSQQPELKLLDPVLNIRLPKRKRSNEDLCLICQSQSSEPFVSQPKETSCKKLFEFIVRRSECADEKCVLIKKQNW